MTPRAISDGSSADRTTSDPHDILETTELPGVAAPASPRGSRLRPPSGMRRPALYLAVAAAGAVLVNVLTAGQPAAHADLKSVSVAEQLGVSGQSATGTSTVRPLEQLVASRSQRQSEQNAAAQAQAAADKAERDKRAAAAAAAKAAAAKAAAEAAAKAKAAAAARSRAAAAAPAVAAGPAAGGSFQSYALSKLGGDSGQFSCLENLWGKESGWNPTAQNPSSTAYGIPQFLDSTWAGTGIAKTSDGYRQIDAGLIYVDQRYGSPCGAWAHSQSAGWY
jgi:hypothetical protein